MADEAQFPGLASVIISEPQMEMKQGQKLSLQEVLFPPLLLEGLNAFEVLQALDGAVLILVTLADGGSYIYGSAALVAPGIAVAAGHVVEEHRAQGHFDAADVAMYAFGPATDRLHAWLVTEITYNEVGDIAVLMLRYAAEMPKDLKIRYFATSARLPTLGDRVSAIGFRPTGVEGDAGDDIGKAGADCDDADAFYADADDDVPSLSPTQGAYLTSSGPVTDLWPLGRDALLPRPSFAAALTTIGAMSGGPVLDSDGRLIGIVSRSMEPFEDEPAITCATMIWDGLFSIVTPVWPPQFWPGEPKALGDLIETQDRWRLHWSWEAAQFRYQAGGDGPEPGLYDPFDPPAEQG